VPPRDRNQNEGCRETAAKRRERKRVNAEHLDPGGRERVAERNRGDRGECRTRGHADQARIRQRIAKKPLHHRAGNGKRRTDEGAQQRARQAQVDEHKVLSCDAGIVRAGKGRKQNPRQRGQRDAGGPDRQRQNHGYSEECDTACNQQAAACVPIH
jgi:hypothetical protein